MIPVFRNIACERAACSRLSLSGSQPRLVGAEPEQEPRQLELLILMQHELLDLRCSVRLPWPWASVGVKCQRPLSALGHVFPLPPPLPDGEPLAAFADFKS